MSATERNFRPNILGGVPFGIGVAPLIECFRGSSSLVGLDLGGAMATNLYGGLVLTAWLILVKLDILSRGQIFLWSLAITLVAVSGIELLAHLMRRQQP